MLGMVTPGGLENSSRGRCLLKAARQLPVPVESCIYKSQLNAQTDGYALHGEIAADYTDMVYAATHVEVEGCRKAFIATTSIKPPFGTLSAQRTWAAG
jgi:1,4-dihydroxy-2-naphthoyl-CoA synthase